MHLTLLEAPTTPARHLEAAIRHSVTRKVRVVRAGKFLTSFCERLSDRLTPARAGRTCISGREGQDELIRMVGGNPAIIGIVLPLPRL